jgi:type I restriction enzyme S subunit
MIVRNGRMTPLRYVIGVASGGAPPEDTDKRDGEYPVYGSNGPIGYASSANVPAGTLLLGRVGASGAVHHVQAAGWATDNVLVLTLRPHVNPRYLYYALSASDFASITGGSAQPLVTGSAVKHLRVWLPDQQLQAAISSFLDRETAHADTLVAKYERLIELLEEKRVALITQAVTKGLDPNVPMKDSGVEWIGQIPKLWQSLPIRRISRAVLTGGTPSAESFGSDGIPWFTPANFWTSDSGGETIVLRISKSVALGEGIRVFPVGAVLVVSIGNIGGTMIADSECCSNQQINAIVPNERIRSGFLSYALVAARDTLKMYAMSSLLAILNQSRLRDVDLPVPPLGLQGRIEAFLDRETARADALVAKAKRAIVLIKEHRSALITSAVTGQIDIYTRKSNHVEVPA